MANFAVQNINESIYTLNPDGTEYKHLLGTSLLNKNRIGEYKKIVLEYTTDTYTIDKSIDGLVIYFDPALYMFSAQPIAFVGNAPTSNYWVFQNDATSTPGTYSMFLNVGIGYASDVIKNDSAEIEIIDSFHFNIIFKYYQIYDVNDFLNPTNEQNRYKLLKDRSANPNILEVSGISIYNNAKIRPRFYTFLQSNEDVTIKGYNSFSVADYKAGFYAKNHHETTPYFDTPQWFLDDGTNSLLQLTQDTKVDFWINAPIAVSKVDMWMIRTDTSDNSVDMRTNYEASFVTIPTNGGASQLDNKIYAPSQQPTLDSGVWKTFFHVKNTELNNFGKYRFIAVVYYDSGGTYEVNSFISDEYSVSAPTFDGVGYGIYGKIEDYFQEYLGNDLTVVVEERLRSTVNIYYGYMGFSGDILNRLGLVVPNDIRRYLVSVKVEVYEDFGTTRQWFDRLISNKLNSITYSNPDGLTVTSSTDTSDDSLNVQYDFRVRYESWILNLQTDVSGVPLGTPTANQDWAGRDLRIKFSFELFYDDYINPFSDVIVFIQKLHPNGYSNELTILRENDETINELSFFCSDIETHCLKAVLDTVDNDECDYNLITTAELQPGSITTIEENEEWLGVLPQLDSLKFVNQETEFCETDANTANFCLKSSEFNVNSHYKISAIAKKVRNLIPPTPDCLRITEDGDPRITDSGDYRITETCP